MHCRRSLLLIVFTLAAVVLLAQAKPAAKGVQAAMTNGAKVYRQFCITCHQADAGGVPRLNPPLIKTPFVLGDKKSLIEILIKGKTEPVEIDGEVYTNPMPPQVLLNDQQIADVLSFIRNNFGNKASPVTVAEVKKVRAAIK